MEGRVRFAKFKPLSVSVASSALAAAMICCDSENPVTTTTASSPTATSQNTPPVKPHEIRRSDGGKTFVRDDGWPIPSFDEAKREELETSIPSGDGRSVKVHRAVINPLSLLYTGNPLHSIGMRSRDILIHKVKEYRTSAGIFCYKFQVNDAGVDESTNELRPTRGLLYSYSYYDEDGDGIFESLIYDEKDRFGHEGFVGEPHVPKWAIAKDK
jgi:hypothetical protein